MLVCQWHLDIVYGKQGDALRVMRAWGAEKFSSSEFRRAQGARLLAGFVGASTSHVTLHRSPIATLGGVPGARVISAGWLIPPAASSRSAVP